MKPCQLMYNSKETNRSIGYAKENTISPVNELKKKLLSDRRKDANRCNLHILEFCESCMQTLTRLFAII